MVRTVGIGGEMKVKAVQGFYRFGYAFIPAGQELNLPHEQARQLIREGKVEAVETVEQATTSAPRNAMQKRTRRRRTVKHGS